MFRFFRNNQKGSAILLAAVALPALIGIGALVIDLGNLYVVRTRLSNAADAAALGGGTHLPKDAAQAKDTALTVAEANGIEESEFAVSVSTSETTNIADSDITVDIQRQVPLLLAPIFGKKTVTVTAHAKAEVRPSKSVPWIVPFVMPKTAQFNYTDKFTMRVNGDWTNPNKRELDYMNVKITPKQDFDTYLDYLSGGYKESFSVGNDMEYYAPSSGGQPSVDAFATRVAKDSNTDPSKAQVGDPRVMLIPLVDSMLPRNTAEGTPMKIVGFVAFWLDNVHKGNYGTSYYAQGYFLNNLNVGAGDWSDNSSQDFGTYSVKLIE
ncbi:Hypothetical protein LUCI_3712 [Lucifera butyrica]|uniref:Putative Flp pilus-assembly TadG-like N-terminal domain-containing protein n=1 Tax=Lucifera butyrica TaxID=1351585 RepID=A0A498RBX1_9FIRM|nr:pilus assembly protein TadG-related protein [Lucifera butyrica]VBB08440.1 Hypothetical protein LUCI_3712 [Lucifera butyrica]